MSLLDRDGDGVFDATNTLRSSFGYDPVSSSKNSAIDALNINEDNWLDVLTQRANSGDEAALDKLIDYLGTKASDKTANDWKAQREDTAYQRLVNDLQKAGISPYVLSGASPIAASANSHTLSGSQFTSQASSKRSEQTASRDRAIDTSKMILSLIGTALMALAIAA